MTEGSGDSLIFRSHKAIPPFCLHRPTSVDEAIRTFASEPNTAFLAGGVDLVPAMRGGRPTDNVVHLGAIDGLASIERDGHVLSIGGAVTYRQLETDPVLQDALPDLARAWRQVANIRVRLAGTLGGNIMSGNMTYDALPALVALGAQLHFATMDGDRTIDLSASNPLPPLADFSTNALLVKVTVPLMPTPRLVVDRSFKPVVALFLAHRNEAFRAAVTCAYHGVESADGDLAGGAAGLSAELPTPIDDHWASGGYRQRLISILIARGVAALANADGSPD